MSILHATELVKSYGDRRVLDGVSLTASPGRRVGLVGENGVGKSTLLRLLAGVEEPDSGTVERPSDCGFLWQETPFAPDATVRDVVDDALADIRAAKARLDELAALLEKRPDDPDVLAEYGEALGWAQDHDLWDADRRAELVLHGLGLATVDTTRRLDAISGGQRSRLALAALLIRRPRALLLDEPTNHLDDEAVAFVERELTALPGVVVVASHDRVFLDEVCTDIVDLDPARGGVTRYGGAYSDYLVAKRAERARWVRRYLAEQTELGELRVAVDVTARAVNHAREMKDNNKMSYGMIGDRVQKQISRRVRNAQQRLDELVRTRIAEPPEPLRFSAALTGQSAADRPALALREVRVDGRLEIGALDVPGSARLLVTGPNGSGKSTLLTVLAGRLAPDAGAVWRDRGVRVGLLEQDVVFPDARATARTLYAKAAQAGAVPLTQLGLLPPRDLDRPVGALSVGQRRRVALALLIARPPQVLLLDEPTNHLSLSLAEELEEALGTAPGAVVIATHDRWLRRTWDGPELALVEGRVA
ncbi:macrolide transport system ATP-binding/permease protein [Actinokineospora alba]|uniref:Macrolide transport system ATP-binding/permease protein n=2 Tax=Actinokineospora alba TaxID=504798 RepID=A0A1H0R2V6_9PSEU|nr:macrolide transport system ATP-binding/permease protein [Actinokineospora alba]SDI34798.1 macrolide transport system ATP-binding/permease protein [Actinokineospora alba]SDP23328.1 macrolide transport system ATP-binding/permease protein [Actinokineospora alba]